MLRTACLELTRWPEPVYVSVNISAVQVSHDLVDEVEALLEQYSVRPGRLVLVISALELNGRVESARASDATDIQTLFRRIGKQVAEARTEMSEFDAVGTLRHDERTVSGIRERVAGMHTAVAALSTAA